MIKTLVLFVTMIGCTTIDPIASSGSGIVQRVIKGKTAEGCLYTEINFNDTSNPLGNPILPDNYDSVIIYGDRQYSEFQDMIGQDIEMYAENEIGFWDDCPKLKTLIFLRKLPMSGKL